MRPEKNIGKSIKKLHITPSVQMHQRTLRDILKAQQEFTETKSAVSQSNIWRIIMKTKVTKLLAVAAIVGIFAIVPVRFCFTRQDSGKFLSGKAPEGLLQSKEDMHCAVLAINPKAVIIRGRLIEIIKEIAGGVNKWEVEVFKILHGEVPNRRIKVIVPIEPEKPYQAGAEVIIFLSPYKNRLYHTKSIISGSSKTLDSSEKYILNVIKKGAYRSYKYPPPNAH